MYFKQTDTIEDIYRKSVCCEETYTGQISHDGLLACLGKTGRNNIRQQ